jgi:hypothetical protein
VVFFIKLQGYNKLTVNINRNCTEFLSFGIDECYVFFLLVLNFFLFFACEKKKKQHYVILKNCSVTKERV